MKNKLITTLIILGAILFITNTPKLAYASGGEDSSTPVISEETSEDISLNTSEIFTEEDVDNLEKTIDDLKAELESYKEVMESEVVNKIITYLVTLLGGLSGVFVFLRKVLKAKNSLDNATQTLIGDNSALKKEYNEIKANIGLLKDETKEKVELLTTSVNEALDTIKEVNAIKAQIDAVIEVVNLFSVNNAKLVSSGVANDIHKILDKLAEKSGVDGE